MISTEHKKAQAPLADCFEYFKAAYIWLLSLSFLWISIVPGRRWWFLLKSPHLLHCPSNIKAHQCFERATQKLPYQQSKMWLKMLVRSRVWQVNVDYFWRWNGGVEIQGQQVARSRPQFMMKQAIGCLRLFRSPVMHRKHILKGFINKSKGGY